MEYKIKWPAVKVSCGFPHYFRSIRKAGDKGKMAVAPSGSATAFTAFGDPLFPLKIGAYFLTKYVAEITLPGAGT